MQITRSVSKIFAQLATHVRDLFELYKTICWRGTLAGIQINDERAHRGDDVIGEHQTTATKN